FAAILRGARRPIVIVGQGALARPDGAAVLSLAAEIAAGPGRDAGWNGLAVLHTAAARGGGLDIAFVPGPSRRDSAGMVAAAGEGEPAGHFCAGTDELGLLPAGHGFMVYLGSHGDAGAQRADVVLPGAAHTEKLGTMVNTEGRVQRLKRAGFPPGDARDDWAVL